MSHLDLDLPDIIC